MDTGKHNYAYYEGYEGETEFVLSSGNESIHIWDGYISDIFGDPIIVEKGWKGLTKDYNELTGPYGDNEEPCQISTDEYLADALLYRDHKCAYEESSDVLEELINWLRNHKDSVVFASVN